MAQKIQFHFDCCALCRVNFYEEDGNREPESADLLGFWRSHAEALAASKEAEELALAEHEAQYKVVNGSWPAYPWNDPGYQPHHYEIIPLANVQSYDLADLHAAIECAAIKRVYGVGVAFDALDATAYITSGGSL